MLPCLFVLLQHTSCPPNGDDCNSTHLYTYIKKGRVIMILVGLVALAVVVQVIIAKSWIVENTENLFGASIWYATSMLNVVVVGRSLSKSCVWLYITRLRPGIYANYRHWSMEQEVENIVQAWLHIKILPIWALWSIWTFPVVVATMAPVIAKATGYLDTLWQLILLWTLMFLASITWVLQEHSGIDRKRQELGSLRSVYRLRFKVSELLSMYECLRVAPRVFWEEYKCLPDVQVTETTNRKFRERAAPYSNSGANVLQRRSLIIAVLAVIVAVLTFAEASIDGGIVGRFVQELSK